jgi:hypothetical protein
LTTGVDVGGTAVGGTRVGVGGRGIAVGGTCTAAAFSVMLWTGRVGDGGAAVGGTTVAARTGVAVGLSGMALWFSRPVVVVVVVVVLVVWLDVSCDSVRCVSVCRSTRTSADGCCTRATGAPAAAATGFAGVRPGPPSVAADDGGACDCPTALG